MERRRVIIRLSAIAVIAFGGIGLLLFLWPFVLLPCFERSEVRSLIERETDAQVIDMEGDYDVGVSAIVRTASADEIEFGALSPSGFATPEAVHVGRVGNLKVYEILCHPTEDRTVLGPALVSLYADGSTGQLSVRNVQDAISKVSSLRSHFETLPDCLSADPAPREGDLCRVDIDDEIRDADLIPCRVSR